MNRFSPLRWLLFVCGACIILFPALRFPLAELGITTVPPNPFSLSCNRILARFVLPLSALLLCFLFWRAVSRSSASERPPTNRIALIISTLLLLLTFPVGKNPDLCAHLALRCVGACFVLLALRDKIITTNEDSLSIILRGRIFESRGKWFLIVLGVSFAALVEVFCATVLGNLPHVADAISMCWQGKVFANGRISVPNLPEELRPFFVFFYAVSGKELYSIYPPGQPLLFALGFLINAPYLVCPLLGAGTLVGFYLVGREIGGERVGRLAALLGGFSPFLFFMSASFMAHCGTLFFSTYGTFFFLRITKGRTQLPSTWLDWLAGALCGFCFGMAFLCRPYTVASIGFPFLIASLLVVRRCGLKCLLPLFFGLLVFSMIAGSFLEYNRLTTGDALTTGYQVAQYVKQFQFEFNLRNAFRNTVTNLSALQLFLFAWPIPSLFLLWWFFASRRADRWDLFILSLALCQILAYAFYSFQDLCFGPRFFYCSSLCWVVLSARAIVSIDERLRSGRPLQSSESVVPAKAHFRRSREGGNPVFSEGPLDSRLRGNDGYSPMLWLLLALCLIANFCRYVPNMRGYWMASPEKTLQKVASADVQKGLVLVQGWDALPMTHNDIDLDGPIIYALNRGRRNLFLLDSYPERDIYLLRDELLVPVRVLSEITPGEVLQNSLLLEKKTNPLEVYAKVDAELDEEAMNRIALREKSPFFWSDLALGLSDEIFMMDFWGRIYLRNDQKITALNRCPFIGQNRRLVACSFCRDPKKNGFVILDHRGGLYWLPDYKKEPVVLEQPGDDFITTQIELCADGTFIVLRDNGGLLRWEEGKGYTELASSPVAQTIDYRMCLVDGGEGAMLIDARGGLHPWGTAMNLTGFSWDPLWSSEAARAIRALPGAPKAFVTMDDHASVFTRGNPAQPIFNKGFPYYEHWEYAVDLEVGRDGRTLYLLNRNGEVWTSRE